MKKPLSRRSRMRGVAAVEFAFVLIPMILLVTGVAEFGRAIYQYEALTKATRNAARYLATYLPGDPAYPIDAAKCLAVYGSTTCGAAGTELAPGLTTTMVVVCDAAHTTGCSGPNDPPQFSNVLTYDTNNGAPTGTPSGSINLVAVKITGYQYQPIHAYSGLQQMIFGDIITVMRQVS